MRWKRKDAKGISYLTRNVYDWGKKPCQLGGCTSVKRSRRRPRLVARESPFAEGKRDDIFSPATSGHVLKLLPAIFLQRISEEEEAREGEGTFSQILGCLDVKDASLQVPPQEKPLQVILRGEEFLVKRNLPGQRVGAKAWFDLCAECLREELNYKFSAECPCLGRNEKSIITDVDDLIFTGSSKYINEIFLPKIQGKFDTSASKVERLGD